MGYLISFISILSGGVVASKTRKSVPEGALGIKFFCGRAFRYRHARIRRLLVWRWTEGGRAKALQRATLVGQPKLVRPGPRFVFPGLVTIRFQHVSENEAPADVLQCVLSDEVTYNVQPVMFYNVTARVGIPFALITIKEAAFDPWMVSKLEALTREVVSKLPSSTPDVDILTHLFDVAVTEFSPRGIEVLKLGLTQYAPMWPAQLYRHGLLAAAQPVIIDGDEQDAAVVPMRMVAN